MGDLEGLPGRASRGEASIKGLSKGFEDLSKNGRLTAASVQSFGASLAQLGGRAGLAAAGIGLAVGMLLRMREALQRARLEVLTQATANHTAALEAQVDWMRRAASAGEFNAATIRELADKELEIADAERRRNEVLREANDKLQQFGKLSEADIKQYSRSIAAINGEIFTHQKRRLELEAEAKAVEEAGQKNRELFEETIRFRVGLEMLTPPTMFFGALTKQLANEIDIERKNLEKLIDARERALAQNGEVNASLEKQITDSRGRVALLEAEAAAMNLVSNTAENAIAGTAAGAFNIYADALDKTVSLNAVFAGGFDRAMRNMAAATVRSVGQQAAAEGALALARGFAALGTPGMQAFAAFQFKAAAIMFGLAAGAGVGAGLLSVNPAGGGGGGPMGGSDRGPGGGKSGNTINVTVIGVLDHESRRTLAQQLKDEMDEGDL